jgi:hypothetical protein
MTPTTRRGSGSWPAADRVKGEGLSVAWIADLPLLPCPTARPERGGTAAVSKSHRRPLRLSQADIVRCKDKARDRTGSAPSRDPFWAGRSRDGHGDAVTAPTVVLELPSGLQVLDQLAFEDLPGGTERQRRDELDSPRVLVAAESLLGPRDQSLGVQIGTFR